MTKPTHYHDMDSALSSAIRITEHNTLGIADSALTYMVQNHFYFNPRYEPCLYKWFLRSMSLQEFCTAHGNIGYGILKNGTIYNVIYHACTSRAIHKLRLSKTEYHVKLSFRLPHKEFSCKPTVLVKLYASSLPRENI